MPRQVEEWIGRTDDDAIPARVKLRILQRQGFVCAVTGLPFSERSKPEFDHVAALVNGGAHREGNLQAIQPQAHKIKTAADVAIKVKADRIQKKRFGLAAPSRHPIPGSKASPWKRRLDGSTVRRDDA